MGGRKLRVASWSAVVPSGRGLAPFSSDPKTGFRLGQVGARPCEGKHGCSPTVHPLELGGGAATHLSRVGAGGELANCRRRSSNLQGQASPRFGGRVKGLVLIHAALRRAGRFTSVFNCLVSASWT